MLTTSKILIVLKEENTEKHWENKINTVHDLSFSVVSEKTLQDTNFSIDPAINLILLECDTLNHPANIEWFTKQNQKPYLFFYHGIQKFYPHPGDDSKFFGYVDLTLPPNIFQSVISAILQKVKYISKLEENQNFFFSNVDEILSDSEIDEQVNLLKSDRSLLNKTLELIQFGSWIYEATGKVFWSEEIYKIFGINKQNGPMTIDTFFELILPSYRIPFKKWIQSFFNWENQIEFEYQAIDSKGNLRYFESRGELIVGINSKPKYLLATTQDITNRKIFELKLSASHQFAQATIDALQGQIAVMDESFRIIAANQSWMKYYHLDSNSERIFELAISYFDFFNLNETQTYINDKIVSVREAVSQLQSGHISVIEFEITYSSLAGKEWFNVRISKFPDGTNYLLVEHELINKQKIVESRLRLMANVFKNAKEGIFITDTRGTILEVNETFTEITGYSREEAIGNNPRILKSGRQSAEFYSNLWHDISVKGHWYGEVWNRRKNGEVYAEMATISAVTDIKGENEYFVAIFSDITWIKEHERQLKHIAHYDALTSLPNRVLLADRLGQAIEEALRRNQLIAIAYLDLDGFKEINDTYGHGIGDEILIIIANRFRDVLKDGDTLARIGGDEFIAVITDLNDPHDCEPILNNLLIAASETILLKEYNIKLSASIGATLFPQDASEGEQLLRHADQAMYLAKLAGKNCYHLFDISLDQAIKTRRESLEQIRIALREKQFVLYYQPKVNMKTGQVIGVEALIRWQHPVRGLVAPSNFLPIIEEHPEAVELGEWVISEALRQIEIWEKVGIEVKVSVNIGARQIQQSDFVVRLSQLLEDSPTISPEKLELEILETSALEDIKKVTSVMEACKRIGVHFALDDFGTGYSSLTYLKHLPADILKIDQSFVKDMLLYPDDMAIVKGVIGLVSAFQREVIAEGVETVEHGTALINLGCVIGQGYGIARPMPAQDLPAWISNWKPDPRWNF